MSPRVVTGAQCPLVLTVFLALMPGIKCSLRPPYKTSMLTTTRGCFGISHLGEEVRDIKSNIHTMEVKSGPENINEAASF